MREIKFKAWDGEKIRRVYAISNGHACHPESGEEKFDWVLMQFTGLRDANGVDIYEGDIMPWNVNGNLVVVFKKGKFQARFQSNGETNSIVDLSKLEVIGNVHENPELLQ